VARKYKLGMKIIENDQGSARLLRHRFWHRHRLHLESNTGSVLSRRIDSVLSGDFGLFKVILDAALIGTCLRAAMLINKKSIAVWHAFNIQVDPTR
jgi:hypothetical protein